ncbi:MAG: pyrimidine/purine nucleoside phosphorylase [Bacteroidota bacterium]
MITVNEYFGGNVKSLAYESAEGKSTIGIIEKGEYQFGTSLHETMTVIEGSLTALLPEEKEWKEFNAGESFEIDANKSFQVKADSQVSYLCKYK